MKKIFPIITTLILLSLFGLIYFQILWLTTAKETKEKQLRENIYLAVTEAANELMDDKSGALALTNASADLFSNEKLGIDPMNPSVLSRYTRDEVTAVINKMMKKHFLETIPFEFAISDNSLVGEQMQSDQFFRVYADSARNTSIALPLEIPSGSGFHKPLKEEFLVVIVPNQSSIILREIFWFVAGSILFTLIIITAFFITIRALLRQKKLSEIKSDFINNMTHEFKTPIATISLAVDALKNQKVIEDKEKHDYFTAVIKEENIRMNKQVETILRAALLDKNEVKLNMEKLSAHELIRETINKIELLLNEKNGKVELLLNAKNDLIVADEMHFANLLNNLLDNALKYSKENLLIKIHTGNIGDKIRIKIEDNGIGMTKDTLSKIFEKFYRAHTGNLHDVKGFGLGLSYVKTMVEAHGGVIKAESSFGKGASFTILLPVAK